MTNANDTNKSADHFTHSSRNTLIELWEIAAPHVSTSHLEAFANVGEDAEIIAANLHDTLEGIGCLVANDKNTGNFQSKHDVPQLLFMTAKHLRMIEGLIHIANEAQVYLHDQNLHRIIKEKHNGK